jgi:hypothetical protein
MPDAYVTLVPMQNVTIAPGWTHKEAGAELLGVSIRQLENLAALKRIRKQRLPRQTNERSARVLYSVEDIEAIKAGKPNVMPETPEPSEARAAAPAAPEPRGFLAIPAALIDLLRERREQREPLKPWLTLDEAAEYSGLTRAWLLKEAEAGQGAIAIRDMGRFARGGRWRFLRADLERAE